MNFEYHEGGDWNGKYYPKLRPLGQAMLRIDSPAKCAYIQYEPGNATHYDVAFMRLRDGMILMTVANFNTAMIVPNELGMHSMGYMKEKLGLNEGDCYALIPLVNWYFAVERARTSADH